MIGWSVSETTFIQSSIFKTLLTSLLFPERGASPVREASAGALRRLEFFLLSRLAHFPFPQVLSNRMPPVCPLSSFHILLLSFFLQVSLSLHRYAFKNLSDLFLVSEVTEIRWVVQQAFLTTSLTMICFSNVLSPRPGERQEGAW